MSRITKLFLLVIFFPLWGISYNERGEPIPESQEEKPQEKKEDTPTSPQEEVDKAEESYKKAFLLFKEGKRSEAFQILEDLLSSGKKDSPFSQKARYVYFMEKARERQPISPEFGEEALASADGFALCAEKVENRKICLELEKKELLKISNHIAKLRLSILYYWEKNYELAHKLLIALAQENSEKKEIPFDYMWYYLGKLYEEDPLRRDYSLAKVFYQKVLAIPNSTLHKEAKKALSRISF